MNKRIKKKVIRRKNKQLVERYPFLKPHNYYCGYLETDNYKYDYTLLDEMPTGWRKRFGLIMCEMIREALLKDNLLEEYRIDQIKEKYGSLRWYDSYGNEETSKIISQFEYISEHTCIVCGKLDVKMINNGWMVPLCEKCNNRNHPMHPYSKWPESKLEEEFQITRITMNGKTTTTISVKEILDKISK